MITDVDDYINEANRQLNDERFYKKVDENPTGIHTALVDNAIDGLRLQGHLTEKMATQSKTNNPLKPPNVPAPKNSETWKPRQTCGE